MTTPVLEFTPWETGQCSHVDFISDLHLQASNPKTAQAFFDFLSQRVAAPLVVLGDLFEVWIGDDCLNSPAHGFERKCLEAIAQARHRAPMAWVCGNRDFLVGPDFHRAAGWSALTDPSVIRSPFGQCLVSHGDAWCVADVDYMAFRHQIRNPDWCKTFLHQPLEQRAQQARALREQSQHTQALRTDWADVDLALARTQLQAHQCQHLIHGHTHRPADQALGDGLHRHVLSDWDLDSPSGRRAEVLRWHSLGFDRHPLI